MKTKSKVNVVDVNNNKIIDLDEVKKTYKTKSSQIRYLLSLKYSRAEVAKMLGIRYQHVRNVEITPIKKAKVEVVQIEASQEG